MLSLIDSLYCSIRKDEIRKLRKIMRRLTVENFFEALTKSCWEFGIQYEILIKNNDLLELKLSGLRRQNIVRFHRCDMVFTDDYERFINTLVRNDVNKGIYITTGVFEFKIVKSHKKLTPSNRKVRLEDCISFCRKQMGFFKREAKILKTRNLRLYRYLPE